MKRLTYCLLLLCTAWFQTGVAQQTTEQPDFFATDKIQDIQITFPVENWSYVLDSLRFNGDSYCEATVVINGQTFEGAGVHYRGTKSFAPGSPRNPFNIKLNYTNKELNINGYASVKLSSALRDPSMIREVLGYEIARNYMPAPRANYARLTINGVYYGLMVNVESVQDPQFRKRYFHSTDNSFFKVNQILEKEEIAGCKNSIYGSLEYDELPSCYENNFEKLSDHGTKELMNLARILNEDPKNIESILRVDETLWMLAFNNVIVNLSSYSGQHSVNYYLYQDDNGRFTPIIWDLNLSFGSFKNIGEGSDISTRKLYAIEPLLHENNPAKPLISKLLANDNYRKIYLTHLRTILYDYFVNEKYVQRAGELRQLIREDIDKDPNKEYDLSEFDDSLDKVIGKKSKIPGIVWLMSKRTDFLKKHAALAVFPPEISLVEVAGRKPLSNKQVENFKISAKVDKYPKRVWLMYRFNDTSAYTQANMTGKGSGMFEVTITPKNGEKTIEYYIVAENAGLYGYSPANYMWENHTSSLVELNK